jgi:hypothetical protein
VEEVKLAADIHRLERIGLSPWAPGELAHWIRLRATVVSGRRIA